MEFNFLLPGDTVQYDAQTFSFHRNKLYEVSKVFFDEKKNPVIYVRDKEGCDILLKYHDKWSMSTKTRKDCDKRMLTERLRAALKAECAVNFHGWNTQRTVYYEIRNNYSNHPGKIFIEKFNKEKDEAGSKMLNFEKFTFDSFDDYLKFFEKELKTNDYWSYSSFNVGRWTIPDSVQKYNDYLGFCLTNGITVFTIKDEAKLTKSRYTENYIPREFGNDFSMKENIDKLLYLLFDSENPPRPYKDLIMTVIDAYIASPPSHGATAISKLLCGKSKTVSQKQEPFNGLNPLGLKQSEMFVVTDWVETVCYSIGAFLRAGTQDLGNTGGELTTRGIDFDKVKEIKDLLN